MGKRKSAVWNDFSEPCDSSGKVQRVTCKYCRASVAANLTRLQSHQRVCTRLPRTIGILRAGGATSSTATATNTPRNAATHTAVGGSLGRSNSTATSTNPAMKILPFLDRMDCDQQRKIDFLLSKAIHSNACAASLFDDEHWAEFFNELRPAYRLPGPEAIGGKMLDDEYHRVMTECLTMVRTWPSVCVTVDGATAVTCKGVTNLMAGRFVAFFMEHLKFENTRETANVIYAKVIDFKKRLNDECFSTSNGDDGTTSYRDVFWIFNSDSVNTMRKLQ